MNAAGAVSPGAVSLGAKPSPTFFEKVKNGWNATVLTSCAAFAAITTLFFSVVNAIFPKVGNYLHIGWLYVVNFWQAWRNAVREEELQGEIQGLKGQALMDQVMVQEALRQRDAALQRVRGLEDEVSQLSDRVEASEIARDASQRGQVAAEQQLAQYAQKVQLLEAELAQGPQRKAQIQHLERIAAVMKSPSAAPKALRDPWMRYVELLEKDKRETLSMIGQVLIHLDPSHPATALIERVQRIYEQETGLLALQGEGLAYREARESAAASCYMQAVS